MRYLNKTSYPESIGDIYFDFWGIYMEFETKMKTFIFNVLDNSVEDYHLRWNFFAGAVHRKRTEIIRMQINKITFGEANFTFKASNEYIKDFSLNQVVRFAEAYDTEKFSEMLINNNEYLELGGKVTCSIGSAILNIIQIRNGLAHEQRPNIGKYVFDNSRIPNEKVGNRVGTNDIELYKELYSVNYWMQKLIEEANEYGRRHSKQIPSSRTSAS
ncbi:hypothetical protein BG808_04980 [Listeria monocytogenes]|nr:hypothetical protein [Listeria monocytogenes]